MPVTEAVNRYKIQCEAGINVASNPTLSIQQIDGIAKSWLELRKVELTGQGWSKR